MRPLFKLILLPVRNYRSDELAKEDNRLSTDQTIIIVVLIVSILLSIATNYLKGDGLFAQLINTLSLPGIFGLAVVILCAVKNREGKSILEFGKVMSGMVWGPILLVGIATCLSSALTSKECGFMSFFSRTLLPVMDGKSVFFVYAFIIIVACVPTNLASNMGIGYDDDSHLRTYLHGGRLQHECSGHGLYLLRLLRLYIARCRGRRPLMYSNPDLTKRGDHQTYHLYRPVVYRYRLCRVSCFGRNSVLER